MMAVSDDRARPAGEDTGDLGLLFHRLNNQLGIILANAELLEVKSGDELRSYFNSDKDLAVACRATEKAAERIAAFVAEQRPTTP